jgi:hypothetical protein
MSQPRSSQYTRFAVLLPELAAVVVRRDRTPERIAAAGVRLGGLLAWGAEQSVFAGELTGAEIAEACRVQLLRSVPPVPSSDFLVEGAVRQVSSAIARFKVVDRSGEPCELLVSQSAAKKTIVTDGIVAERLVRLIHARPRRMSAEDLATLFRMLADIAAEEADLAVEEAGLRLGAGSKWFSIPRVVKRGDHFLLETALEGQMVEDMPALRRESAYRRTVLSWARMLLEDGILHTFLRRDQIRFHGDAIGASRWTGTCQPGFTVQAFVPTLARAAFARDSAEQARQRSYLLGLLAHGLGLSGSLDELADLCLALISQGGCLEVTRPLMPGLFIREQERTAPDRQGLVRLFRQLVWFRDLGHACGVTDLALPWRELAREVGSGA